MAARHARIVVAEAEGAWRTSLVRALEQVEPAIRVTDLGQEVRRAMEEVDNPPRIIVLGQQLKGIGGLEALYQAERALVLEKKTRPSWPRRTISLITEVRSDAELLDVYRRRGVTQFLYRDDPLDRTVAALLANLRSASRTMVRIDAQLLLPSGPRLGTVYDLSRTGAQLVLDAEPLEEVPRIGSTVELRMAFRGRQFTCPAEVRRLSTKVAVRGKRLVLGIHFAFDPKDDGGAQALEDLLSDAAEEFELVYSTTG